MSLRDSILNFRNYFIFPTFDKNYTWLTQIRVSGCFSSRAVHRLGLDPTQTRPTSVGWRAEEPGLLLENRSSRFWVRVSIDRATSGRRNKKSIEIWKKKKKRLPEFGKYIGFWKISPVFGKTRRISSNLSLILPNLLKSKLDLTKYGWDLAGSLRI